MYHLWTREHRPTAPRKTPNEKDLKSLSQARIRDMLSGRSDSLESFGLGTCRSLRSFEESLAVNFSECILLPGADYGGYSSSSFEESTDELHARVVESVLSNLSMKTSGDSSGDCKSDKKEIRGFQIGKELPTHSKLNTALSALDLVKQFMVDTSFSSVDITKK